MYNCKYDSKVGEITLISDGKYLTNLYIENQAKVSFKCIEDNDLEIFKNTKKWLDEYFSGKKPSIELKIKLEGSEFQKEVWSILNEIPYGKLTTYKEIADKITKRRGIKKMSAQAVGKAIGKNPISIIVPCHRVIGSDGSLTGYNGGIQIKEKLLRLENIDLNNL